MTDRRLILTASVSIALHLLAALAVAVLPRMGGLFVDPAPPAATVELVMEEHKGDVGLPAPPPPPPPPPPQAEAPIIEPPPQPLPEPDRTDASPDVPRPMPPAEQTTQKPFTSKPMDKNTIAAPPPPPEAPIISLRGTDSPSDAIAEGNHIVPASPDAVFHNRPPEYPMEAARLGQGGAVVLTIHISPDGKAAGVDLTRSSGYALLDRAAREAAVKWRFLPAVKDGQAVASEMTVQFYFDNK